MSSPTEALISMLLPSGSGGGGGGGGDKRYDSFFHYCIENTEAQLDLPIGSGYKISAHLVAVNSDEIPGFSHVLTYGSGTGWNMRGDNQGCTIYDASTMPEHPWDKWMWTRPYYTITLVICIIIHKNDKPLFMTNCIKFHEDDINYSESEVAEWHNYRSEGITVKPIEDIRVEGLNNSFKIYVPGTMEFASNEISVNWVDMSSPGSDEYNRKLYTYPSTLRLPDIRFGRAGKSVLIAKGDTVFDDDGFPHGASQQYRDTHVVLGRKRYYTGSVPNYDYVFYCAAEKTPTIATQTARNYAILTFSTYAPMIFTDIKTGTEFADEFNNFLVALYKSNGITYNVPTKEILRW